VPEPGVPVTLPKDPHVDVVQATPFNVKLVIEGRSPVMSFDTEIAMVPAVPAACSGGAALAESATVGGLPKGPIRTAPLELAILVRPPPAMVRGTLTVWPRPPVTFPVTVMGGKLAPAATTAELWQVNVANVQVQPVPVMLVAVKLVGGSVTVTVPLVGPALAAFETVIMYAAPTCNGRRVPRPVTVAERLGGVGALAPALPPAPAPAEQPLEANTAMVPTPQAHKIAAVVMQVWTRIGPPVM
jgi:hypothetical protein